ncbi:MAG TPA: signal peptidase I [Thermoanaerobaculia bacterium]
MPRIPSLARTILQPLAIAIVLGLVVRGTIEIYSIPSASMAPALLPGDQILVTRYLRGEPQRGDVVVFHSPRVPGEVLVKRVVAVPGDLVESHLGRIRVAGHTLPEPYVLRQGATGSIEPRQIAQGEYFLLGDNRDDSIDSRNWGTVPHTMILGRVEMVLWSVSSPGTDDAHAAARSGPNATARPRGLRLFKCIH